MSSKEYAVPLRIEGRALAPLQRLYLLFCSMVGMTLLWLPVPVVPDLLLLLLFTLIARHTWKGRTELGGAPVQLVWDAAQRWWWTQGGVEQQLQLCGDSYLSRRLCILNFTEPAARKRRSLILMPAGSGTEPYRRLLVRFRVSTDPLGRES